jgi:hypothetical protein
MTVIQPSFVSTESRIRLEISRSTIGRFASEQFRRWKAGTTDIRSQSVAALFQNESEPFNPFDTLRVMAIGFTGSTFGL